MSATEAELRILVYSSDAGVRRSVVEALGPRPHPDLAPASHIEVATAPMVLRLLDAGGIDLAILDAEASPAGGLGIAKQLRDEIDPCPPLIALTARHDDDWLANWSRVDATASRPVDPIELARVVVGLLRAPARG